MKTIEQIDKEVRAAIIASVPEIVELSFGCRLATGETYIGKTEAEEYYFTLDEDANGDRDIFNTEDIDDLKILGRPIQLADVLRAMDVGSRDDIHMSLGPAIGSKCMFFHGCDTAWNLSKSYEDQSDEVKRFLHSVIVKK